MEIIPYAELSARRAPSPFRRRGFRLFATLLGALLVVALCGSLAFADYLPLPWSGGKERAGTLTAALPKTLDVRPVSDPSVLRDVSMEQAEEINAAIPLAAGPNPAAASLSLPIGDGQSWTRALDCMTAAVYYEAASEADEGLRAVAQVVLNRVRHPAFPNSVCGVVFQGSERRTGCQFTFTCDGSLARLPSAAGWARARRIASAALAGYVYAPVGWSTHYHTHWVAPYWAPTLLKTAVVGAHIFYRWPDGWGRPAAFAQAYSPNEVFGAQGGLPAALMAQGDLLQGWEDGQPAPTARTVLAYQPQTQAAAAALPGAVPLASTAPKPVVAPVRKATPRWVIGISPAEPAAVPAAPSATPAP